MTPKERAIAILNKFEKLSNEYPIDLDNYSNEYVYIDKDFTKKAALIAADEMINQCDFIDSDLVRIKPGLDKYHLRFWRDVRKELEKL